MACADVRVRLVGILVVLLALVAHVAPLHAQKPTFDLEGVVTDAQQAVLPGVSVSLRNLSTGLARDTTTDESGRYVFASLPPAGQYVLQTELSGFATERRENLTFNAGQRVVINVTLRLSAVEETITVTGETPHVQTTTSEVSKTIDSAQLTALPVAERNYFRLLTLDSNVVARGPGSNGLFVGGGDVWNFGTYVDGTNNFSKWLTLQRAPQRGSAGFALETVKEVQIITNQFSAEFGGHSAGVMNMITKSGANTYAGAGLVVVRPGDWDARPPLAAQKVPFSQQQFGGNVGGPIVRDRVFFFGSYERRRERSQVNITSPDPSVTERTYATPADEDQGHFRTDIRFSPSQTLATRYNMVRWKQDQEAGGLSLPGTGYNWTNNVDTVQAMWTSIVSDRALNEVRAQFSRYYDLRAAKCDCVQINRAGFSITGGNATGTWGVIPEDTWDISNTLSLWRGNHFLKIGGGVTYDVTTQSYLPFRNGVYNFASGTATSPHLFTQAFALVPGQDVLYPKAWVFSSFVQDDWRVGSNLTLNLGLRYDIELIKDIPDWPAPVDRNNLDPRIGFAWDPTGDQRWSVRGGFGRFTQQNAIFTIIKGALLGRNGLVTLALPPSDPAFPEFPNVLPGFPAGATLPARNIQEIAPDLENEYAWQYNVGVQRQLTSRTSVAVDVNINRGQKHGFLDMNFPAPISRDAINAAGGQIVRTSAEADATRPIQPGPNGFRRIEWLTNEGRTWYEGIRFGLQHRATAAQVSMSYTWSDAEDRLNHWEIPEYSHDPALDRADSVSNTPHNFVASATWNVPGRNVLLTGWRLSTVVHAQSGNPYTPRYAQDLTGTTQTYCVTSRTCNVTTVEGRNTARAAAVQWADFNLTRVFAIPNGNQIEFRADVFNVLNNVNFTADGYMNIVTNPNFGKPVSGAYPGRQFQVGAIYRF